MEKLKKELFQIPFDMVSSCWKLNKYLYSFIGLYKKARAGEIRGFTGIDQPYEAPDNAEIVCKTMDLSVDECVMKIVRVLEEYQVIPRVTAQVNYPNLKPH